jgi:hypothetical protein
MVAYTCKGMYLRNQRTIEDACRAIILFKKVYRCSCYGNKSQSRKGSCMLFTTSFGVVEIVFVTSVFVVTLLR